MARHYSLDLRERVVAAVANGATCREVAALFDVAVSSVVKWSSRKRSTGSAAAKAMGGRRFQKIEAERDWLLSRREAKPDATMRELAAELAERGIQSYGGTMLEVRPVPRSIPESRGAARTVEANLAALETCAIAEAP